VANLILPGSDSVAPAPLALQTQALTRRFGDHVVVDHLDLTVAEGEVFGLLGRNGAGKSTPIKNLIDAGAARLELQRACRHEQPSVGYHSIA
jgi:ABC-2 type transport system ATP-binding protein